ncbi:hypothetical protein H6F43_11660 [Leptolyngbya sp. FACHB-36]|uniref:hypothetical protein n=1 Tax=Leptolyngbya sp. FACHB-36 TaxID=2692808 RepID=UPI00168171CA|nr:hypothetical protein [Leptolyngbya sp. FACHB-36]MBD2020836.1 hypothetical protein [Leptolyngbya sp. FACHB-36]
MNLPLTPRRLVNIALLGSAIVSIAAPADSASQPIQSPTLQINRASRATVCPSTLEPLIQGLLQDLPGYINRVYSRTGRRFASASRTYAISAGRPELDPLLIGSSEYPTPNDATLRQVFFTVLERQYNNQRITELQQFHWLFLTQTSDGWQVALMRSRIGTYPIGEQQPLTPPRDSSQSVTAQAVRSWLRDCQAGSLRQLRP